MAHENRILESATSYATYWGKHVADWWDHDVNLRSMGGGIVILDGANAALDVLKTIM